MAGFDVTIDHNLSPEDARARLDGVRPKLESEYGVSCTWKGQDELTVSRKGLDGTVKIETNQLVVSVKLGMLMGALAGPIKAGITKKLTDLVAS